MKSGSDGGVVERLLLLLGQAGGGLGEGIDGEVTELGRQWMIRKLSDNQVLNCPPRQPKQPVNRFTVVYYEYDGFL